MDPATLSFEALMSTANSSALVTAKSITDTIPASFSSFAVVGPIPEYPEFLGLEMMKGQVLH